MLNALRLMRRLTDMKTQNPLPYALPLKTLHFSGKQFMIWQMEHWIAWNWSRDNDVLKLCVPNMDCNNVSYWILVLYFDMGRALPCIRHRPIPPSPMDSCILLISVHEIDLPQVDKFRLMEFRAVKDDELWGKQPCTGFL